MKVRESANSRLRQIGSRSSSRMRRAVVRVFAAFLIPLAFSGAPYSNSAVAAESPPPIKGFWLGTLRAPAVTLRIQLTVTIDQGHIDCSLDSLDQDSFGLACSNIIYAGSEFAFDIPVVKSHWSGRLSEDASALIGTWSQGGETSLDFKRQGKLHAASVPPPITYDPAIPPVFAADMQSVLAHDLDQALKTGDLAPETSAGVAIGVVRKGVRRVFAFGAANPDSIFEIGSITKTFTGLILAQMLQQGKVALDEPLRDLLPAGTVAKPQGEEITLLDLVTQHSGLPRMPDNLNPADEANPYVDYGVARLYAHITQHGVAKSNDVGYLYSNLGFALLGQALSNQGGTTYADLLKREVTDPLGMRDTSISLSEDQMRRLIAGHLANHKPAHTWDLNAFAGAGAIRSTASDMLRYLEAQLHPKDIGLIKSASARTLPAAIRQSQQLRADVGPDTRIAFAWMFNFKFAYWHNGATGGYSSLAFFNPDEDFAAVVLLNTAISKRRSFEELVAEHIRQRFMGEPAVALGPSPIIDAPN